MKQKKIVCKSCKGKKVLKYRGRIFKCGACSVDPLQKKIAKIFAKSP